MMGALAEPLLWGPWTPGLDDVERQALVREMRCLALMIVGERHPLTQALTAAADDLSRLDQVADELQRLPAMPRRRILALAIAVWRPLTR
jgi:hypothetical protein